MTGRDIVESVKKIYDSVGDDVLFRAVERLERMIEKAVGAKHKNFEKEALLLGCGGGVTDGYDDMYNAYVNREAARSIENWECYGNYDSIFALRWVDFNKEVVRTHKSEKKEFGPDWRW